MNTDINVNSQLPVIHSNFEEVKATLDTLLGKYKNLIVTEETLKDCKATQKELAGLRNKIDARRKEVKQEIEKPIKAFEEECKKLGAMIEEVEKPIKEGIQFYDNQRREEKRQIAEKIIAEIIEKHGIYGKYAAELTVIDKYVLLGATEKEVKEDVEYRAFILLEKQKKEEERKKVLETSIENENKTLDIKLSPSEFTHLVTTEKEASEIISYISDIAQGRREQEQKAKERLEAEKQEAINKAVQEAKIQPVIEPVQIEKGQANYYVVMKVTGHKGNFKALADFLDNNGFERETLEQGEV